MRRTFRLAMPALLLLTAACFHQVVQTGRTAGTTTIELPWTKTFIFGIVPAEEINTAAQCPGGVAVVETQRSFMNGLVGAITLGIFTPVDVKITCAAGSASIDGARTMEVANGASTDARAVAVEQAVEQARTSGAAVVVRY